MPAKKTTTHVFEAEEPLHVRKRLRSPVKFQPPLMPLIDVMFTLMLFFLLATTIRTQEGLIAATLPEKGGFQDKAEDVPTIDVPIEVLVIAGGWVEYRFPNERVDPLDRFVAPPPDSDGKYADPNNAYGRVFSVLTAKLQQLNMKPESATILICPTPNVGWQYVVDVYNQAVRAKFTKVGFSR